MVQWLRLLAPNTGDTGSVPCWGTKVRKSWPHTHTQKQAGLWIVTESTIVETLNILIK